MVADDDIYLIHDGEGKWFLERFIGQRYALAISFLDGHYAFHTSNALVNDTTIYC